MLPDSALAAWALGARGDRERALADLREAVRITPIRIDYHMELGAVLLCLGRREGRGELEAEGIRVLKQVETLPRRQWSDAVDRDHAKLLLADPSEACDHGREEWLAAGR